MKNMRAGLVVAMMVMGMAVWGQATMAPAGTAAAAAPMSEKQKELLEQTDALLKLAAELKVSVDKSTKDQLSLDVVRKAEAVEKMARELKGKIK